MNSDYGGHGHHFYHHHLGFNRLPEAFPVATAASRHACDSCHSVASHSPARGRAIRTKPTRLPTSDHAGYDASALVRCSARSRDHCPAIRCLRVHPYRSGPTPRPSRRHPPSYRPIHRRVHRSQRTSHRALSRCSTRETIHPSGARRPACLTRGGGHGAPPRDLPAPPRTSESYSIRNGTPTGPVPGRAATVHQPEAHEIPLIDRLR